MPSEDSAGGFELEAARWLATQVTPPDPLRRDGTWDSWYQELFFRVRLALPAESDQTDAIAATLDAYRGLLSSLHADAEALHAHFASAGPGDSARDAALFRNVVDATAQAVSYADHLTANGLRHLDEALTALQDQPETAMRWHLVVEAIEQSQPTLLSAWQYGEQVVAALPVPAVTASLDGPVDPGDETREFLDGWLQALERSLLLLQEAVSQLDGGAQTGLAHDAVPLPSIAPMAESVRSAEHTVRSGILNDAQQATAWTFEQSAAILAELLAATVAQLEDIAAEHGRSPMTVRKQDQHVQRLEQVERARRVAADVVAQWGGQPGDATAFDAAYARARESLDNAR